MFTSSQFRGNSGRSLAILDSGIGGLSVLKQLRARIGFASCLYMADNAYFPYGEKSLAALIGRLGYWASVFTASGITDLVLACNSASAAWHLGKLDLEFPHLRMHSVLDAGARAAAWRAVERVGVVATPFTVDSGAYADAIQTYTIVRKTRVIPKALPDLAPLIESGELDGAAIREIIGAACAEMIRSKVSALVLGCTHYPLCLPLWEACLPPEVKIIDPAVELAAAFGGRHCGDFAGNFNSVNFVCSGQPDGLAGQAARVLRTDAVRFHQFPLSSIHEIRNGVVDNFVESGDDDNVAASELLSDLEREPALAG